VARGINKGIYEVKESMSSSSTSFYTQLSKRQKLSLLLLLYLSIWLAFSLFKPCE
jgi:hypothetical protein